MILAVDVGLRNLALCVINTANSKDMKKYTIKLWDVFNILDDDSTPKLCNATMKSGKICNKKCSLKYTDNGVVVYSCKPHFPKKIAIKPVHQIKQKRVNEYLLQDIAVSVLSKLKEIYQAHIDIMASVTRIVIELQPKINNKMKMISHLIYGKFCEMYEGTGTTVRFIRASQKLKVYKGPAIDCHLKTAYSKRKYLSIEYTKWFLKNGFCNEETQKWLPKIEDMGKADDAADAFLLCLCTIK